MSLRKKNLSKVEIRKQLTVNVIEAKSLGIKKSEQSVFCVVSCNRVLFQTKRTEKHGKLEWNETFTFKEVDINEKTSEIRIVVFVVDKLNKESMFGDVSINISDLTPNVENKIWYNIKTKTNSTKGKLLVETLLFSDFKALTSKRSEAGEFFKKKLSWGGKQGSQTIIHPTPVDSLKYQEELEFMDSSYEEGTKSSSKHYGIYDSNSLHFDYGSGTEKDADEGFNRDIMYQDETDFEDAFSTPNASSHLSLTEDENTLSSRINGSQYSTDASSSRVRRKKKRKEKKIKILDIIDENNSKTLEINNNEELNEEGNKENETIETHTETEVEILKNSEKGKEDKVSLGKSKKRPSFFSRQSFIKLFKSRKHKSTSKIFEQDQQQTKPKNITKEKVGIKKHSSKELLIEEEKDAIELQSHSTLKKTLKEYFTNGKIFIRHIKRLNNDFILPGIKKDVVELGKLFECIQKFIYIYKPKFREAMKKIDDDTWDFGQYFLNLHKFFDEEIRKYRIHQLNLSVLIDTETIDQSHLKQFLEYNAKLRKDNILFSDLLLSPIHHLYSITHIIERISLLTPANHKEYSDIIKASKLFNKLVKELSNINPESKDMNDDIQALEKMIQFSPTILKFNISNGKRNLIKQGRFKMLKLDQGIYKEFNVYGILFNDILLICKELNLESDFQLAEVKGLEKDGNMETQPIIQKKYELIAVLKTNNIFLVDPSDGIDILDTSKAHEYVDNKLEIVEVGAAIHRIIFSNVNEKLLWKSQLTRVLSEVTPIFSVYDQYKLYKFLLAVTSENISHLIDNEWPHNLCLSSLSENTGYYVNINQRNVHDDINILRSEMISMREYFDKKLSGIQNDIIPDSSQQINSRSNDSNNIESEEMKTLREQFNKLTEELDEEKQKYKEMELKYELLMKEMKNIEDRAAKREQETQSYIQKLGYEIINQRKQFSKEIEKVLELLGTHQARTITPTITPEKTIRKRKSRRLSQKKSETTINSTIELPEKVPDNTPGKIIVAVSPRRSTASSINYESSKENKPKPIKLKNTIFTQDENSKSFKNKILNFGGGNKKKDSPTHWRKTPINNDLNEGFSIKKPKKVDWGRIRGENYLSDDFISDADGGNSFIVVSDFSKNDHINVRKNYLSDCSEEEEYKSGVSLGKQEVSVQK